MENNQNTGVVCTVRKDPLIKDFAIAALLIAGGIWCWADRAHYPAPEQWDFKHINEAAGFVFNHYLPFLLFPVGAIFAVKGFVTSKQKVTADETGITCSGNNTYKWENIDSLDAKELKSKGWIFLETGGKKIKLDSWKLSNFKTLVEIIEKNLPAEKQKL